MALKYNIVKTTKYKRDCKAAKKSGLDIEKLELVVRLLAADVPLPPCNRDHALTGEWRGYRECHQVTGFRFRKQERNERAWTRNRY